MIKPESPVNGFNGPEPPEIDGWHIDYTSLFDDKLRDDEWGRYGWGEQRPSGGAMGRYDPQNARVVDGVLHLSYRYVNDEWTSAGVSCAPGFSTVGGRWELRARFPKGRGFGFAFVLWPVDEQWPPGIDLLQGHVNGPSVSSFVHPPPPQAMQEARLDTSGLNEWHTYGVIIGADAISYTVDGEVWAELAVTDFPETRMWLALQNGAIDPESEEAKFYDGGVPGGVPNPETPAEAAIEIDWVAHYVED